MEALFAAVSWRRRTKNYTRTHFSCHTTLRGCSIIAMAYPASGAEGLYRNNIQDVARFLNGRHGENYMIFNLSERHYDNSLFGHRVLELGFPDHYPPTCAVGWTLCRTLDAWLSAAPENVVIVHCT